MATTVQRSLRAGFWLGWKIESSWADPLLFLIYSVIRPLGSALILVVMFFAVSGGRRGPLLDFFVVGSAFWPLVLAGLQGLVTAVLEDRELWRMTRSVYTSPISWPTFLIGRTLAATLSAGFGGVVVILMTGRLFLGVPLALSPGDVGLLAVGSVSARRSLRHDDLRALVPPGQPSGYERIGRPISVVGAGSG